MLLTRLLGTALIASSLQAFVIMVCICDLQNQLQPLDYVSIYHERKRTTPFAPEEANLFRKRNTQVLSDGNNGVFEGNTINDIIGEIFSDLKGE